METKTKFWMVWRRNGSEPRFQHQAKVEAEREATRLARKYPGEEIFVLEAVRNIFCTTPVSMITLTEADAPDLEGVPF